MKILVAVDGSPFTKRMLAYLAAHDEWLGGQHAYTVLTVAPAVPVRAAAVLAKDVLKDYYDEQATKVFKPIRVFLEHQGVKATYQARHGDAAEHIAALADKGKFDLLMIGSHGHGMLANLVLGSVAMKVVARSKVPVLIIR